MGIVQVQNNLPAFEFAGESSRDYGVYITDVNVFDGAARDIELVDIPGRNGAYIIDNGRFSDIAITYDCAMGADGSAGASDFADNMAAIRAWLSSVSGYARLEDDINPDEYRMAAFSGGIEVNTNGKRTGEFSIEFTARPERFLKSGETAVTVTSGATITNPTKFSAAPLLMVDGYGVIDLDGQQIIITDTPIGTFEIPSGEYYSVSYGTRSFAADLSSLNAGDHIEFEGRTITYFNGAGGFYPTAVTLEASSGNTDPWRASTTVYSNYWSVSATFEPALSFTKGTQKTVTMRGLMTAIDEDSSNEAAIIEVYTIQYDGDNTFTFGIYTSEPVEHANLIALNSAQVNVFLLRCTSSKGSLGEPLYFDLDIGEAYKYESGNLVSVNKAVSFGAELPKLPPGETAITFDNTVTQLQIAPRWWTI